MVRKKIVLHFPHRLVNQPVVCNLVKRYDLEFTILKAYITPREQGLLVLELKGEDSAFAEGMQYLDEIGIERQWLSQDIVRDETGCTHCGACINVCPSSALTMERPVMLVRFDKEKCVACELCVGACPVKAMEVHF